MKLLAVLAVLLIGFFVADTVAEKTAESRAEERIAAAVPQADGLSVDVQGALFLPQLLGGSFDRMLVTADEVRRGGVSVEDLALTFRNVSFSLGDLMSGAGALTVTGGSGTATISERAVNQALAEEDVDAEVALAERVSLTAGGRTATVENVTLAESGKQVLFSAPPLEPLALDLPRSLASVEYTDVAVEHDRLVLSLTIAKGKVEL